MTKMNKDEWMKVASAFYDGEDIEIEVGDFYEWRILVSGFLELGNNYRVKPVAASIDWDAVLFDFICTDSDGKSFGHFERPEEKSEYFKSTEKLEIRLDGVISSFKPGNCHWKESLVCRPAPEPEMVECETCGGTGETMTMKEYGNGPVESKETCPECHGLGEVEAE